MIYSATFSELLGNVRSENVLFLHFYTGSSTALQTCLFSKVPLCFHFHFRLYPSSLVVFFFFFLRVCSGRGGGGVATRHISRRALIGCRFSPDTAVIVFCRGSSCPWYELCAEEWSSSSVCVRVCVFSLSLSQFVCVCWCANDGVNKTTCWLLSLLWTGTREVFYCCNRGSWMKRSGGFSLDQTLTTSGEQGKVDNCFFFFYVSVTTSPICHPATVSLLLIVS